MQQAIVFFKFKKSTSCKEAADLYVHIDRKYYRAMSEDDLAILRELFPNTRNEVYAKKEVALKATLAGLDTYEYVEELEKTCPDIIDDIRLLKKI